MILKKTIPGFENYNKRVREPGGFYLPNAARNGRFNTETGKAFLYFKCNITTLEPNQLMMMTLEPTTNLIQLFTVLMIGIEGY